jgi:hypothetical protein
VPTDYWFIHSQDGGATWTENRLTPTSFDIEAAPVSRGYFLGDYEGLTTSGTTFHAVFVQANSGNTAHGRLLRNDHDGVSQPPFGTTAPPRRRGIGCTRQRGRDAAEPGRGRPSRKGKVETDGSAIEGRSSCPR